MLDIEVHSKHYQANPSQGRRLVLDDIHINLQAGEFLAVVGPSGCGKSTLLHIVAGLDKDFEGHISWQEGVENQPRLGYVFQNPRLLPWLNVRDNIGLVLDDPSANRQEIDALLEATGLMPFSHYHPSQLSVGMQRRAALARAFVVKPSLLLMDEPFVSLDSPSALQLRELLLEILSVRRTTVIFVTHDLHEATMLADRILFFSTSPARIVGESRVDIPRHSRNDERAIDACYRELQQRFTQIYQQSRFSPSSDPQQAD
ncbi:MAG: ABC transporter ATP-binding protein [Candidatus Thiodiazotropha sp.]